MTSALPPTREFKFTGLPMQEFNDLWILTKDGRSLRFIDVVEGFILCEGDNMLDVMLSSAIAAEPDTLSIHFRFEAQEPV